jgi:putative NADPH-quinone reductase
MRVLVIFAHPVETSFNAALHRTILETLGNRHEVRDIDLYADDFDPRLSRRERLDYHDTSINQPPELGKYIDALRWAECVVFCFPVWCFGLPAILKGFFDRVMMPGVGFDIDGALVTPKLQNIRRVVAVTTYGRDLWRVKIGVGDLPKAHITRYFRWFCAKDVKISYLAHYHMNISTDASRGKFQQRVTRAIAAL